MDSVSQRYRIRSTPRSATSGGRVDGFSIIRPLNVPSRASLPTPTPPKKSAAITTVQPNTAPTPRPTQTRTTPLSQPVKSVSNFTIPPPTITEDKPRLVIKKGLRARLFSKRTLAISVTLILLLFSGYVSLDALLINRQAKATQEAVAEQTDNADTPAAIDEKPLPPDTIKSYTVAPNLPRVIRIGDIGVEARVLRMGVTTDNAIDTPKNSNDTGWYDGSAKPGEAGAMILNGHYSGLTKPGVFHGLEKLKPGAIISIEKGDGTILRYAVEKTEKLPANKVQMDQLFVSRKPNAQSLNLITCSGNFDTKTQTYDQRVIVYASAIK